ncbi:MAG: sigma-54-dependent Fis family transcriptional regulator [Sandaracinaceae bacterium]|nr:sigma-54-dependent Fis family transcriptional regulator [Sandaracinaceae bacterium]
MTARILVVDDEVGLRNMLDVLLRRAGYETVTADCVEAAKKHLADDEPYDLVVSDLLMPDGSGMDVLHAARAREESTQVVIITAYATTEAAVDAMRHGAYDYVQKPFKNPELLATLEKALEKRSIVDQNRALRERVREGFHLGDLVGKSAKILAVMDLVHKVAASRTNILITGESGTGKEVVARALHYTSNRKDAPFVVVNCGALPEALMESELFGHEKGAFTGATARKDGLFRAADTGTLFLDEVGELSPSLQVKLLRVLQERRVRAVGAEREVDIDVRVIAATNRDIEKEVHENRFRQDLYYRLNVIHIAMPKLSERADDIPLLAEHFLKKHAAFAGKRLSFSPDAMRYIVAQPYPGNVRELENLIERAVTLASGERIVRADLPNAGASSPPPNRVSLPAEGMALDTYLGELEKQLLMQALERCGGVRTAAAKFVGMSFRSFRYRLAKYGLGDADEADHDATDENAADDEDA